MIVLVIDLGTPIHRACLIRMDGRILFRVRDSAKVRHGAVEIDGTEAFQLVPRTSAAAIERSGGFLPEAMGISSMLGRICLDKSGRALPQAESFASAIGPEVCQRITARHLSQKQLLPKLLCRWAHEQLTCDHFIGMARLADCLVARLTGAHTLSSSTASYSGFFDVERCSGNTEFLKLASFGPRILPRTAVPASRTSDVLILSCAGTPSCSETTLTVNPSPPDDSFLAAGATRHSGGTLASFSSLSRTKRRGEKIAVIPFDPRAPMALPGPPGGCAPFWKTGRRLATLTRKGLEKPGTIRVGFRGEWSPGPACPQLHADRKRRFETLVRSDLWRQI